MTHLTGTPAHEVVTEGFKPEAANRGRALLRGSVAAIALAVALGGCATNTESDLAREGVKAEKSMSQAGAGRSSLLAMADAMAADGDHSAAIPVYRRAHAKNSGAAAPLIGLGRSLMAMGQVVDAETAFRKAVDREENNPDALAGHGSALLRMDRPGVALPLFEKALSVAPAQSDAVRGLALAQDMTGRHDDAIATYERHLGSGDLKLRNNYGLSLALHGKTEDGILVLEEVMRDGRAGPSQRQNMALAYLLAGRDGDARRMAAIDQDTETLERTLDYFRIISLLPAEDRLSALVAGATPPKHDKSEPANRAYDNDAERKAETAQRIVGVEEEEVVEDPFPEPLPEPEPEPEPEPAPHQDADLSDIPLLAPGEGWSLQIAAYRKASQLVNGWKLLREQYFDIIGDLDPRRTEIDFGDRIEKPSGFFYRLNAGPLTSLEEANDRCRQMRELGADCWVRPPEVDENTQPTPDLVE